MEGTTLFILAILFLGSFVHGVTGFGIALVSMGLITMLLPIKESTLIVLSVNAAISLWMIWQYRQHIHLRESLWICAGGLLGTGIAFFILSSYGTSEWMKQVLGVILLFVIAFIYFGGQKSISERVWLRKDVTFFAGGTGGLIGGVFAVGGPFFAMYYLIRYAKNKQAYLVNMQVVFVILIALTIVLHMLDGGLTANYYTYTLLGIPVGLVGMYLGLKLFRHMQVKRIQQIAYVLIISAALYLMISPYV